MSNVSTVEKPRRPGSHGSHISAGALFSADLADAVRTAAVPGTSPLRGSPAEPEFKRIGSLIVTFLLGHSLTQILIILKQAGDLLLESFKFLIGGDGLPVPIYEEARYNTPPPERMLRSDAQVGCTRWTDSPRLPHRHPQASANTEP